MELLAAGFCRIKEISQVNPLHFCGFSHVMISKEFTNIEISGVTPGLHPCICNPLNDFHDFQQFDFQRPLILDSLIFECPD